MTRALKLIGPVALILALHLAGCGEGDTTTPASKPDDATTEKRAIAGNGIDRAFVTEMVPHHRSAVEMAELAKRHSNRTEVKQLADAIIATQDAEIRQMQRLDRRFADAGVTRRSLDLSMHEMGMHMDPAATEESSSVRSRFPRRHDPAPRGSDSDGAGPARAGQ